MRTQGERSVSSASTPSETPDMPEQALPLQYPTGTVTFLFTDIEGSTRLWEEHPAEMRQALSRHHALVAGEIERNGGRVIKRQGEGDSVFAVFSRATDAVAAAGDVQQAL